MNRITKKNTNMITNKYINMITKKKYKYEINFKINIYIYNKKYTRPLKGG